MLVGLIVFLWLSRGLFPRFVKPGATEKADRDGAWRDPGTRLVLIMIFFAAIYMIGQQTYGGVMNLYVRDRVAKTILGFDVPTTWFLSLNPLIVILGGPFVSKFWAARDRTAVRLTAITKILTGTVLMALSYVLMLVVDMQAGGGLVAPVWILVFYLIITLAELCVFPVGLAEISHHAPQKLMGILMGFWVFTMGFGSLGAGWLGGSLADAPSWMIFAVLAVGGAVSAAVLFLLEPVIRKRLACSASARRPSILRQYRLPTITALHIDPAVAKFPADVALLPMSFVDSPAIHNHDLAVHAHEDVPMFHTFIFECAGPDVSHDLFLGAHLAQVIDRDVVIRVNPLKSHSVAANPGLSPFLLGLPHLALGLIVRLLCVSHAAGAASHCKSQCHDNASVHSMFPRQFHKPMMRGTIACHPGLSQRRWTVAITGK
jgi:hypothetical protein